MSDQLSPAAQAVLDAFLGDATDTGLEMDDMRENVAAALRAAADQVVPTEIATASKWPERHDVRRQILAIAAELDGTQPSSENV